MALGSNLRSKRSVRIIEVGPRDGLQNIAAIVPTKVKIELIKLLAECGNSTIEATSFVSPKWVPQLADSRSVIDGITDLFNTTAVNFPVLVPNVKGLEAANSCGIKEVAVFISASEGFSLKNINCTVAEALKRVRAVTVQATKLGIKVRGYVSCIFECPFDGPTPPEAVLRVTKVLLDMGCYEVSLGDTIGVGTVADVERLFSVLLETIPPNRLAGHFHDTYGQAVANVLKSYDLGIRAFDSSVAGLGGCPFAPGAKGNVATEDVVYAFNKLGIATGIDLSKLVDIGHWISQELRLQSSSRAGVALHTQKHKTQVPKKIEHSSKLLGWAKVQAKNSFALHRRGNDVKITLTQPKRGNVLTLDLLHDLTTIFKDISTDRTVFRIIIIGQGKFFCTGMDLGSSGSITAGGHETKEKQFNALSGLFEAIDNSPQVTIAAINGPCFGGGIGLAFSCDIRLATTSTRFTLSEAKLGLAPAVISKYVLREWGIPLAREAMLTAREVSSEELKRLGIVHSISKDVPELENLLESYLSRLSLCAPRASTLCKELTRVSEDQRPAKINSTFHEMMLPSKEAQYGVEQFRAGNKVVNWTNLYFDQLAKL